MNKVFGSLVWLFILVSFSFTPRSTLAHIQDGAKARIIPLPEVIEPTSFVIGNEKIIIPEPTHIAIYSLKDFQLEKISSIQYQSGMMFGKIIIYASGNKATIQNVQKDAARGFCDNLRALISRREERLARRSVVPNGPQNPAPADTIEKLERLAALKEKGVLSDEEFQEQKKQILRTEE